MLIIHRRIGERIYIGDDIYITVVEVGQNKVRLGIVAPSDVIILREELLNNRTKDTNHASTTNPSESTRKPNTDQKNKRNRTN